MKKFRFVQRLCLVVFVVTLPAAASAEGGHRCTARQVVGDWAYSKTGTLTLPNGATVGFAAVGRIIVEADGNLSGTQDNNIAGNAGKGLLSGMYSLNDDCTVTMEVDVLDAASGTVLRTVFMSGVFDQDASALRVLVTRLVLPNGASLPQVITGTAARLFVGSRGRK